MNDLPEKRLTLRIVVVVLCISLLLAGLLMLAIHVVTGGSMFVRSMRDILTIDKTRSYTDEFHISVLRIETAPNAFTERVRVQCEGEMEAGIEVVDLKEAGIHEAWGTNGQVFYRLGNPFRAGDSGPVQAEGKFSTCEILYTVSTTPSNTIWSSRISVASTNAISHGQGASGVETTLPVPMMISEVVTNWPDAFQRGSWIPLATLGNYKIVVTVK